MEQDVDSKTTHAHRFSTTEQNRIRYGRVREWQQTLIDRLSWFFTNLLFFPTRWAMNEITYGHPIKLSSLFCTGSTHPV